MPPPPSPAAARPIETRSVLAAALVALLAGCAAAAVATRDSDLLKTLAVGVLGAVTTTVGFYFGSSKGSAGKDATIADLAGRDAP